MDRHSTQPPELTTKQRKHLRSFIEGLRSGRFRRGTGMLHQFVKATGTSTRRTRRFCCLGVACEVAIKDGLALEKEEQRPDRPYPNDAIIVGYEDASFFNQTNLPESVQKWYGITNTDPDLFVPRKHRAKLNKDKGGYGKTFRDFFMDYSQSFMNSDYDRRTNGARAASYLNDSYANVTFGIIADCFEYTFLPKDYAKRYPNEGPHEFYPEYK